jgi:hypothetical protein
VEVSDGAHTAEAGLFQRTQHWRSGLGDSISRHAVLLGAPTVVQAKIRRRTIVSPISSSRGAAGTL